MEAVEKRYLINSSQNIILKAPIKMIAYYSFFRFFDGGGIKFGQFLQQCCFYTVSMDS